MLRHVALVRMDILAEHITSINWVRRISEPGTTLAVTSNCNILQRITHSMRKEAMEWETLVMLVFKCNVTNWCAN
jgi:hypothetical protein